MTAVDLYQDTVSTSHVEDQGAEPEEQCQPLSLLCEMLEKMDSFKKQTLTIVNPMLISKKTLTAEEKPQTFWWEHR